MQITKNPDLWDDFLIKLKKRFFCLLFTYLFTYTYIWGGCVEHLTETHFRLSWNSRRRDKERVLCTLLLEEEEGEEEAGSDIR